MGNKKIRYKGDPRIKKINLSVTQMAVFPYKVGDLEYLPDMAKSIRLGSARCYEAAILMPKEMMNVELKTGDVIAFFNVEIEKIDHIAKVHEVNFWKDGKVVVVIYDDLIQTLPKEYNNSDFQEMLHIWHKEQESIEVKDGGRNIPW